MAAAPILGAAVVSVVVAVSAVGVASAAVVVAAGAAVPPAAGKKYRHQKRGTEKSRDKDFLCITISRWSRMRPE
jgi:hypothetical protein